MKEFCVGVLSTFVRVTCQNSNVYDHIRGLLGDLWNVCEPGVGHGDEELGAVNIVTNRREYRELRQRIAIRRRSMFSFSMYKPKNTPKETRIGLVTKEDDETILIWGKTTGSIIVISIGDRRIAIYNPDIFQAAQEGVRTVRDQLVVRRCERDGGLAVHSACISDKAGRGILFVGKSGSGKTTVFMECIANSSLYFGLTCERTLVYREKEGDRLGVIGIPERINVFPGSLKIFPQLSGLMPVRVPLGGEWERPHKVKVHWRDLFGPLGASVPIGSVRLEAVVFPEYVGDNEGIRRMERGKVERELLPEVLSFDDQMRVNWLCWYYSNFAACRSTFMRLCSVPAYKLRWRSTESLGEKMYEAVLL